MSLCKTFQLSYTGSVSGFCLKVLVLKININLQNHSHISESSPVNYQFSLEKMGHIATIHQLLINIKAPEMVSEAVFEQFYRTAFGNMRAAVTFSMWLQLFAMYGRLVMFLCSKHMFICLWNKALCALNGFVMKLVRVDKEESRICSIYECSFGQNGCFWIWFCFFMVGWLGFVLFEIKTTILILFSTSLFTSTMFLRGLFLHCVSLQGLGRLRKQPDVRKKKNYTGF